jgi:predicted transcriptional regulator
MKKKQTAMIVPEIKTTPKNEPDENLAVICECFGIDPEKDKLAYEIFKEIIEAQKKDKGVRTIEITKRAHVTQAAVVYHMNTFIRNGIIIREGREYRLRGRTLDETFDELEQDMLRRMRRMRELAKRIDESFFDF